MEETLTLLGIDAGGTHTDGVICRDGRLVASAKVSTNHEDLPSSVDAVLRALREQVGETVFSQIDRVTLGTTLLVNAQVQGRLDKVGLVLSAGPGLSPLRFALGEHVFVARGGLDHRGVEVEKPSREGLDDVVAFWREQGVHSFACVGKFSPRNPSHELFMAESIAGGKDDESVTLGHRLSGELNFPRRIATAYYNAASSRLNASFLDAVEGVLARQGVHAKTFLLRADGGALPVDASRNQPVQSILSGPAASVMGVVALDGDAVGKGCTLLLDIGGTTTDLALFVDGSPVMDRNGMELGRRRTLVRSLATLSIGVGGDSRIRVEKEADGIHIVVGPYRTGPAAAFGGSEATLLDALNMLNADKLDAVAGDVSASEAALGRLASEHGLDVRNLVDLAWESAAAQIRDAVSHLVGDINSRPIYTLKELREHRDAVPTKAVLVGGPVHCLASRLSMGLGIAARPVRNSEVANAVGAAMTRPSFEARVYADTGRSTLSVPAMDHVEDLGRYVTLEKVRARAQRLLTEHVESLGLHGLDVEVTEAELFATLDDRGGSTKDIRVTCQTVPGILARVRG